MQFPTGLLKGSGRVIASHFLPARRAARPSGGVIFWTAPCLLPSPLNLWVQHAPPSLAFDGLCEPVSRRQAKRSATAFPTTTLSPWPNKSDRSAVGQLCSNAFLYGLPGRRPESPLESFLDCQDGNDGPPRRQGLLAYSPLPHGIGRLSGRADLPRSYRCDYLSGRNNPLAIDSAKRKE